MILALATTLALAALPCTVALRLYRWSLNR